MIGTGYVKSHIGARCRDLIWSITRERKGDVTKMPTVENETKQLLIVATNSGPAVYLAPGEAVALPAFEIEGNAKIEKLMKAGALAVKEESQTVSEETQAPSSKPGSKGN
jgi:hypothetical protein